MVDTPYTKWAGDEVHGRRPVLRGCWVNLNGIYTRAPDFQRHVVPDGLDLTGVVPGTLSGWFPSAEGGFVGVVNYELSYADGRRHKIHAVEQFVPDYLLRERK